jgi:hypothetical protein
MAGPFDFTGQNIENTYQRVLQTGDGVVYDGTGSAVFLQISGSFSGSFYGDGSNLSGIASQGQIDSINSDIANINGNISFINTNVSNLQTDVLDLQITVQGHTDSISNLTTTVNNQVVSIADLQSSASSQNTSINNISSSLNDYVLISATSSMTVATASYVTGSVFTSDNLALSASNALTASYVLNAVSSSFASTASYVLNAVSASYIKQAESASYIQLQQGPGIIIDGLAISSSLRTVNGNGPDNNGNATVSLTAVITGTSASLALSSSGAITGSITEGTVWIISGDPTPANNGDVYIFDSGSVGQWYQIAPLDQTAADARYARIDITAIQNLTSSFASTASYVAGSIFTSTNRALSASNALTASLALNNISTASVSLNTITFTKGDGSTFPITVDTGSGGGGSGTGFPYDGRVTPAVITGSLIISGSGLTPLRIIGSNNTISGSLIVSNSLNVIGTETITGSLIVSGSTPLRIVGGATVISGSTINISGSSTIISGAFSAFSSTTDAFIQGLRFGKGASQLNNVVVGGDASSLGNIFTGTNNLAIGPGALATVNQGTNNVAIGYNAHRSGRFGNNSVVIGNNSFTSSAVNGGAIRSVLLGANIQGATASYVCETSVGIGTQTFGSSLGVSSVTSIGYQSMELAGNVSSLVAIGNQAMQEFGRYYITESANQRYSVAIGGQAMKNAENSSNTVAIGTNAIGYDGNGSENVAIGYQALNDVRKYLRYTGSVIPSSAFTGTPATASVNVLTSLSASGANLGWIHPRTPGGFTISASFNDPVDALRSFTIVSRSIGLPNNITATSFTMSFTDGGGPPLAGVSWSFEERQDYSISSQNTAIGTNAMRYFAGGATIPGRGTGQNTAIGYQALQGIQLLSTSTPAFYKTGSTGQYNTAIGPSALQNFYTGDRNLALGFGAMSGYNYQPVFSASNNTAIGSQAFQNVFSGSSNNVIIGNNAAKGASNQGLGVAIVRAEDNILLGRSVSERMRGGTNNTFIGALAGRDITDLTNHNIGLGSQAGYALATGSNNIMLGLNAMYNTVSSSNNIIIGANSFNNSTLGGQTYPVSNNIILGPGAGNNFKYRSANNICIGSGSGPTTATATGGFDSIGSFSSSLWIGPPGTSIITTPGMFNGQRAPLIGGFFDQEFAYIYGKLGLGQATASYLLDAISTSSVDAVISLDGGPAANGLFVVESDTANTATNGNTGKTAGIYFLDRNNGRIENNLISGSAYIYLEKQTPVTYQRGLTTRNDLVYTNVNPDKGHYFVTRNTSTDSAYRGDIIASITNTGVQVRTGSLVVTGSTIISGSLIVTGSSFFSGSLIPAVPSSGTSSFDLGSPTAAWGTLYCGSRTIKFVGDNGTILSTISATDNGEIEVPSLYTTGNITVNTIISQSTITVVSQSYVTGSTIFGSSSLDTHQFTGSVFISGALNVNNSSNLRNTTVDGNLTVTGSTYLTGLGSSNQNYLVSINPGTGQLYYTSSYAVGNNDLSLVTASFTNPVLTFTKGNSTTYQLDLSTLIPVSSSYADLAFQAISASQATNSSTSDLALQATSASYAIESSYAVTSTSASYAINSSTSDLAFQATSASYAISSSISDLASLALTASYFDGIIDGGTF